MAKSGTGTLTLDAVNTYANGTILSGGTLVVNGSLPAGGLTISGGTRLGGNGTINSAVTLPSGATLAPGDGGPGTLTVNAGTTLQSGSTTLMEISKSPLANDQLRVSDTLTYGGTLVVTNLSGTLAAEDAFQLFSAPSVSGAFDATDLPPLPGGLAWNFNRSSGVPRVVSPTPTSLTAMFSGSAFAVSWPADHTGWRLQTQTNGLNPTNWFDVPGSTATNLVYIPIDPAKGTVFFRLIYPFP